MRRAIAIVAISPRRISYITITLLLLNVIKSGCARDKVLRFRDHAMAVLGRRRPGGCESDAHRKLFVRNWDRPRSVVRSNRVGFVVRKFSDRHKCTVSFSLFLFLYLSLLFSSSTKCMLQRETLPSVFIQHHPLQRHYEKFLRDSDRYNHCEFSLTPRGGTKAGA